MWMRIVLCKHFDPVLITLQRLSDTFRLAEKASTSIQITIQEMEEHQEKL